MTEERSCKTCKFSSFNNGTGKSCSVYYDCDRYSKWQPISNPKVQITDLRNRGDMEIWIGNLKHAGYIRKSELVELVEEAEWTFENYRDEDNCITIVEALEISNRALQALKKDHPEFGGKK